MGIIKRCYVRDIEVVNDPKDRSHSVSRLCDIADWDAVEFNSLARISQTTPSRAGQESVKCESAQILSGDGVLNLNSAVAEFRLSLKTAYLRCGTSLKYRILRSPTG